MSDDCRIFWAKNSPTWSLHTTLSLAWPSSAQLFLIIRLENYLEVGLVTLNVERVKLVVISVVNCVLFLMLFDVFFCCRVCASSSNPSSIQQVLTLSSLLLKPVRQFQDVRYGKVHIWALVCHNTILHSPYLELCLNWKLLTLFENMF